MFQGYLGQPPGGFPEKLRDIILKGREYFTGRPGERIPPVDFAATKKELEEKLNREVSEYDVMSYLMYPKVFLDKERLTSEYGNIGVLDTLTFFHGMEPGEEIRVNIEKGKTLIIKLVAIGPQTKEGTRTLYFELNGQQREIVVRDLSAKTTVVARRKADPAVRGQIGAPMPGKVLKVFVKEGDRVEKGQQVVLTEAMKMEMSIQASMDGVIKEVAVKAGDTIEAGDLLVEMAVDMEE
jgi:pyruvate carboxylase